jgi:hypothetical protein
VDTGNERSAVLLLSDSVSFCVVCTRVTKLIQYTGGIGGIIGSLVFRSQDKPTYHPGLYATMTSQVIIVLIVGILSLTFIRANRRADRGQGVIEGAIERGFRYTL